jgi:Na+-driven multidrug efflux pump
MIFSTLVSFGLIYSKVGQLGSAHAIVGYIMLAPLCWMPINGIATALYPRYKKTVPWEKEEEARMVARYHKILGIMLLTMGGISITLGSLNYANK